MKAAIFDVDGVIIDVRNTYHQAIKETAESYLNREIPLSFIKELKFSRGINNDWDVTKEVLKEFGVSVNYEELVDRFTQIYDTLKDKEELMLDREFFEELRKNEGLKLGVVTGRPKEDLVYSFRKFKLEYVFDVTIDEDDVWNKELRKPHPFPLHLCMESLGVDRAVYIGDNGADYDMVFAYRKLYGKEVAFIHFNRAVDIELPTDRKTDSKEELKRLIQEVLLLPQGV